MLALAALSVLLWNHFASAWQPSPAACEAQLAAVLDGAWAEEDLSELNRLHSDLDAFLEKAGLAVTEGHSGEIEPQRKLYQALAKIPCVKHVCELGFNAGHSAALWLLADADNVVTSFDIFEHDYSPVALRFLGERFPGRLAMVTGNSLDSIPGFVNSPAGGEVRCDIVLVDGGHFGDLPYLDIVNFMPLANPAFHVLLMDDVHCQASYCVGPMKCWQLSQERGLVRQLRWWSLSSDAAKVYTPRGYAVGLYILNAEHSSEL